MIIDNLHFYFNLANEDECNAFETILKIKRYDKLTNLHKNTDSYHNTLLFQHQYLPNIVFSTFQVAKLQGLLGVVQNFHHGLSILFLLF